MAAMVATATGGAFFFESAAAAAVDVAFFSTASNCAFTRALISARFFAFAVIFVAVDFVLVVCFFRRGGVEGVARLAVVFFFLLLRVVAARSAASRFCFRSFSHFESRHPLLHALQ
jgi:hypothetical protein